MAAKTSLESSFLDTYILAPRPSNILIFLLPVQCGTCMNRWYDKSLSIIVCQNGAAGINFEHSVIDGHSVLRFASDVFTDTILTFAENIRKGFQASKSTGPKSSGVGVGGVPAAAGGEGQGATTRVWQRIVWDIDAETSNAIRKAEAKVKTRILHDGLKKSKSSLDAHGR